MGKRGNMSLVMLIFREEIKIAEFGKGDKRDDKTDKK